MTAVSTIAPNHPWDGATEIKVPAAISWILDHVEPLAVAATPLGDSLGCTLAADAVAGDPSPTFATSAMDGYAIGRADRSRTAFTVIGRSMAGSAFTGCIGPGEAVRIMTGARVPPGADGVAPLEIVREHDGVVTIAGELAEGSNVRRRGEDHEVGDTIVARGTRLTPIHVAVLASIGHDWPRVVRRPQVGVLSTGDEVIEGAASGAGIRDTNRPGLLALLRASGAVAVDLGAVGDDMIALRDRIERAVDGCDAVVTTGGVSVGDHDQVKLVLAESARATGGVARWMRVAVRPAKPLMFATIRNVPVFGLPGNPASAFVSYHLFARPAIDVLAGHRNPTTRPFTAITAVEFTRRADGRLHVIPVVTDISNGTLTIRPAGTGGRHHLAATAGADAYAYLPDGATIPAGSTVECGWITANALA